MLSDDQLVLEVLPMLAVLQGLMLSVQVRVISSIRMLQEMYLQQEVLLEQREHLVLVAHLERQLLEVPVEVL